MRNTSSRGQPLDLERTVRRVDARAVQFGRETDRLLHVLHAKRRTVGAHQRIGAVDLGDGHPLGIQIAFEGPGIGLQRDARIVAHRLDEVLAVNRRELHMSQTQRQSFVHGRLEAHAQRTPVVRVKPQLDHDHSPFHWEVMGDSFDTSCPRVSQRGPAMPGASITPREMRCKPCYVQ